MIQSPFKALPLDSSGLSLQHRSFGGQFRSKKKLGLYIHKALGGQGTSFYSLLHLQHLEEFLGHSTLSIC
jgi:hypothetical protein